MSGPAAQPAPQRTMVLAVGLEQYDYGERMDLPGAAAQAVLFARWAHNRGVPAERIRLACTWLADKDSLADAKVVGTTRDELDQVLYELMNEGGDLLLLYWCGHGVAAEGGQSRRLYTSNATRASKANLPVEEIIRLLSSTHGKGFTRQVLIIDACANYVEEMSYDTGLPPGGFGKLTPRPVPQFVYYSTDLGQFAAYNPVEGRAEFSTVVFDWLDQQPAEPFLPNLETMFTQVDAVFTQRAASGQYTQRPVALQVKPFHGIERQHTHRAVVEVAGRAKNSDLLDTDIVRAVRAADELAGSPELDVSALLNVNRAFKARWRIARTLLATVPDRSGPPLLERIMACEVTGPAWHRASDAADLLSTTHRPLLENDLTDALQGFHVERMRHVITALGRIGATSRAEGVAEAAEHDIDKLGSNAVEALARMFQASVAKGGTDPEAALRTLGDFLLRHPNYASDARPIFFTLTPPHADPLLEHWLPSENTDLVSLAANALGHMRLRRACKALADRAGNLTVKEAAPLVYAIGRIGGREAVELLRTRSRLPEYGRAASEGLALCAEYVEGDFDIFAHELIDATSVYTWAVYRAIGMRPDPGSDEMLRRGLQDKHGVDRGVTALALARRQGRAVLDTIKIAFDQATHPIESIMTALAVLRLDDTSTTRSMINDQLIRDADTVLRLDDILFNDVVNELERGGDPRLTDLAYALRWLRLRP
jgi:Caspase domain